MINIHYTRLYCVKIYLLLLLSDLHFLKVILHYHYNYHYHYHYYYHYHYQILILGIYQYNSQFLYFLSHIYILLKIFLDETFHVHKEQNLELLLINIYVVFFLMVFFRPFFLIKICRYTVFICFYFCFYVFIIIKQSCCQNLYSLIFQFFSIFCCNF